MKRRLLYFYPENDVALASNVARFTPPANALALRRSCGYLMRWMGREGDTALYESIDSDWEESTAEWFCLPCKAFNDAAEIDVVEPWGWSAASCHELLRAGVPAELLPDKEFIERIRMLSHRRTSIVVNRLLRSRGIDTPTEAIELTDEWRLAETIATFGGRAVVKTPWSSSGRGVAYTAEMTAEMLTSRVKGNIRRQGSVVVEPHLDKVIDFAMLFEAREGRVNYLGLSLFFNHGGASYEGNIVAPEATLSRMLAEYVTVDYQHRLAEALADILAEVIGPSGYEGPMGIDMMVYRTSDGALAVASCVELNLRWTMGVVAHHLAATHLAPGSVARMWLTRGEPHQIYTPSALITDHRLVSGTIPLTPPSQPFTMLLSATEQTHQHV